MRSTLRHPKKLVEKIPALNIPAENIPVDLPTVETTLPEAPTVSAMTVDIPAGEKIDTEEITETLKTAAQADEAALALKKQIEAIAQAEAMQRQAKAAVDPRLLPLEDKITLWRANGLTDAEAAFIRQNPQVANHPEISNHAAAMALQEGHERDSEGYFAAVKENFEEAMRQLQTQAAATAPEFFRPEPPRQAPPRTPAHYVSAPVSRDTPTDVPRELRPGRITLTAEEREAARFSGISERQYAENKLRLLQSKARGEIQ